MAAPMGRATTRNIERVAAMVGLLDGAPIQFELVKDVPQGGVLFAIPALIATGLLTHSQTIFSMPAGFYPIQSIFLLLALMALARIPSLEALRYVAPGEWGKLLGLDRIPEVRTLRAKIGELCDEVGRAQRWSGELAKEWMSDDPQSAGAFYVDGHVRLYHGKLAALPRRYIARERLRLRGTTDYWVNALDGAPFFVVTRAVDDGLLQVLREEIVPRLIADVPNQPTPEELAADPLLSRFTLVFDREAYSPGFFSDMKEKRIAVLTYHKLPGEPWPESEFSGHEVTLVNGEKVTLQLAERGSIMKNALWVREMRQLSETGHQTSILSTDYRKELAPTASAMFARWCQENYFKYMRANFGLDRLVEYGTEPLPDTTRIVNPQWRACDSQCRREAALLSRESLHFGQLHLPAELDPEKVDAVIREKARLRQSIAERQTKIKELKARRKALKRHIEIKDLPEADRFSQLRTDKKHFMDTIKLIAYRSETSMAHIARECMARSDDARSLMRQLYNTEADLIPDQLNKTLTVRLHPLTAQVHDAVIQHLCNELTETETLFPGTDLRLIYQLIGSS